MVRDARGLGHLGEDGVNKCMEAVRAGEDTLALHYGRNRFIGFFAGGLGVRYGNQAAERQSEEEGGCEAAETGL
jgi:hypothetical protein